ncbi:MAG: hypothetical protein COT89_00285 [Candidatus Colwellbacteria bacterium CG10_big_fil_rev_8_21_14_0_10_42_22]|uniref:Uncharacterized protein n=1 Tax=Candidatus Colwellbacteria bacterium CG10_big_fil_rev_8_21_14_0_10_42_22 TaxID=1974540 RepID=A0A2H0VGE6_9BACT|nr:MAG: hypothetical protein COT89_00285 [Candidatus Colwellbacteria bacterium CG10_big_fil_rev_8_21_14_0_10_42_22]
MRLHRNITPEKRAWSVAEKAAEEAAKDTVRRNGNWDSFWDTYGEVFNETYYGALRELQEQELAGRLLLLAKTTRRSRR